MTQRQSLILIPMFLVCGCETQEPSIAPSSIVTTAPASPSDSMQDRRSTIESMYAEYRVEAFADVPGISVANLQVLEAEQPIVLVDCREDVERAVSMVPGAISKADFEANAAAYREHLVVTYCTIGYRSGVYAADLIGRDFDAINLKGGVLAWAHANQPFIAPGGDETRRVHVYGAQWDLLPDGYESVTEGIDQP